MKKVFKYQQFSDSLSLAEEFIDVILNPRINESVEPDEKVIHKILKGLANDLKFNYGLVFTFGAGIKSLYPTVENLIKNGNLKIDLTPENIVLLSFATLAIVFLEEKKNKGYDEMICPDCEGEGLSQKDCELCDNQGCEVCEGPCKKCGGEGKIKVDINKQEIKTLLEELKLKGIGNGIVKKLTKCVQAIGNIAKLLYKNTPYIITGFLDMIGYASILVPTMNAISFLVSNYNLDMDSLTGNFLSLGLGISSFIAKNGFMYIVDRLKKKFGIKVNPDIQEPTFIKPYDVKDGDSPKRDDKSKLITEQ